MVERLEQAEEVYKEYQRQAQDINRKQQEQRKLEQERLEREEQSKRELEKLLETRDIQQKRVEDLEKVLKEKRLGKTALK